MTWSIIKSAWQWYTEHGSRADVLQSDAAERVRNGSQVGDEELQQLNPLIALLHTILPWINYGRDPNDAEGPPPPDAGA